MAEFADRSVVTLNHSKLDKKKQEHSYLKFFYNLVAVGKNFCGCLLPKELKKSIFLRTHHSFVVLYLAPKLLFPLHGHLNEILNGHVVSKCFLLEFEIF